LTKGRAYERIRSKGKMEKLIAKAFGRGYGLERCD